MNSGRQNDTKHNYYRSQYKTYLTSIVAQTGK